MRIDWLIPVALAGFVQACAQSPAIGGPTGAIADGQARLSETVESCRRSWGSEKKIMPVTDCVTQAQVDFYKTLGGDWVTIALEERAETLSWAEEVDNGKLRGPRGTAELDAIKARADSKRRVLLQQVNAAQQAQIEDQQRRSAAMIAAGAALMAPPPSITCSTVHGDPVVTRTTCR